jgi:hypothetical protein
MVDIAIGQVADQEEPSIHDQAMSGRGRAGDRKGSKARAQKLSAERRREIARQAKPVRHGKAD